MFGDFKTRIVINDNPVINEKNGHESHIEIFFNRTWKSNSHLAIAIHIVQRRVLKMGREAVWHPLVYRLSSYA